MLLMIEKPRSTAAERGWFALSRAAGAALSLVDALVMGPFRMAENRRVLGALAALSDHDLKDIGLARGDLRDAMALPSTRDASLFVAERRAARRLYR